MNPKKFFGELKRRNVYKVTVAYGIVGWLVMQIAATVVPALHLSDAIMGVYFAAHDQRRLSSSRRILTCLPQCSREEKWMRQEIWITLRLSIGVDSGARY